MSAPYSSSDLTDFIKDYHFDLPEHLIAQDPAPERESARLLLVRREPTRGEPRFEDLSVRDLPALVESTPQLKNSLWVRNRSRVIPARFYARRPSGSRHEIVLLEELAPQRWSALVRHQASFKYPQELTSDLEPQLKFCSPEPGIVTFADWAESVEKFLERVGEMPLPPYIKKRVRSRDQDRYQPTWSRPDKAASVAAPTASLHFTPQLCAAMESCGINFTDIILHVGLGTFEPVRAPTLSTHQLHSERIEVETPTLQQLQQALAHHRPVVALGTTAMRTLESLSLQGEPPSPHAEFVETTAGIWGRSAHFIRPSVQIRYTNALFTNFHLPESTLFVLVATFCGSRQLALEAYRHAIQREYRFFSFGDSSLWI